MDDIKKDNNEPPSSKVHLGSGSRVVSALNFVDGRLSEFRKLWAGDWAVCPIRSPLPSRRFIILKTI